MHRRHDSGDAAIEAFLTGNGAGGELASLVAFADELLAVTNGPPPAPSPMLAAVLADGVAPEADAVPPQLAHARARRSRGALVARFLGGLTVTAKVLLGTGVAAASVTAAGAAGVLPGGAQGVVAGAVEAVTPFSFPDHVDDADFGRRVSTDARDGGVDGGEVSADARQIGETRRRAGGEAGDPPADPDRTGLDRAADTPAAGHVPTVIPAPPELPGPVGSPPAAGAVPGSAPDTATPSTPPAVAPLGSLEGTGAAPGDRPSVANPAPPAVDGEPSRGR